MAQITLPAICTHPSPVELTHGVTITILTSLYFPLPSLTCSIIVLNISSTYIYNLLMPYYASVIKCNLHNSRGEWTSKVFPYIFVTLFFLASRCPKIPFFLVSFMCREFHLAFLFSFFGVYKIIFKFFPQLYWGTIDKTVIYLKCTTWWFDIHIHCEMISSPFLHGKSTGNKFP